MPVMKNRFWRAIELCTGAFLAAFSALAIPLSGCGLIDTSEVARYGYIDKTGGFVIPPRFDIAREFSEGLAVIGERINSSGF